eukprot:m.35848 g.35848  ORF g.35848 m.35848 type:complete len:50 (-) comp8970_c0_seq4:1010-1159(-)
MALPVVCVVNNLDRNDDLDSVDPAIAKMLEGKAKYRCEHVHRNKTIMYS